MSKELECIWNMNTGCSGKIKTEELFNKQIRVSICEKHLKEHKEVMILHHAGYDIEEILQQTPEWRKQEIDKIPKAERKYKV